MNKLVILIMATQLAACADLTPMQKTWIAVGVSVAATSIAMCANANKGMQRTHVVGSPQASTQPVNCTANPESCQ